MSKTNNLIGSFLNILNDSSVITKPSTGYVGSLFFGPNQDVTFRNMAPKGQLVPDESFNNEKSFGIPASRTKHHNFHIDFYTYNDFLTDSGLKNVELLNHYNDLIEDAVFGNRFGNYTVEYVGVEIPPQIAPEVGNNVWMTRQLIVIKERRR